MIPAMNCSRAISGDVVYLPSPFALFWEPLLERMWSCVVAPAELDARGHLSAFPVLNQELLARVQDLPDGVEARTGILSQRRPIRTEQYYYA